MRIAELRSRMNFLTKTKSRSGIGEHIPLRPLYRLNALLEWYLRKPGENRSESA